MNPYRRFIMLIGLLGAAMGTVSCEGLQLGTPDPERFGILTSRLDGTDVRRLASDATREINHARVSPDHKWYTFTRYNKRGFDGLATELQGYSQAEIVIRRLDGTGPEYVVRSNDNDTGAANSYWTPDGSALLYASNDNPEKQSRIMRFDMSTQQSTRVPGPDKHCGDPHQVGNQIVFPVIDPASMTTSIWIMRADGSGQRQVTRPAYTKAQRDKAEHMLGDYDPKLSPDGTRIALLRQVSHGNWHMVVVDLATGEERDLSAATTIDGTPEWSSDGSLILFWHVDFQNLPVSGMYTCNPDGSNRQMINVPGVFCSQPAFFPGTGSGPDARIIFSGRK